MEKSTKLIDYLPAIFRKPAIDTSEGATPFIEKFLQLFEEQFNILDSYVDNIPHLLNPWKCRTAFLPWLASWLDLSLPDEWGECTKRSLIDNIFSIYRTRGTPEGLKTILQIYLQSDHQEIVEKPGKPHLFVVNVDFPKFEFTELQSRVRTIREVIEREKPAHCDYDWNLRIPTIQINVRSTIGVDTILGTEPNWVFKE